ncbi:hypothetical protein BJV77DRAFT_643989 [Russula vinacea]|nr:hypothetical protein BJV77DRAFT_643989 [Russula vinacea]
MLGTYSPSLRRLPPKHGNSPTWNEGGMKAVPWRASSPYRTGQLDLTVRLHYPRPLFVLRITHAARLAPHPAQHIVACSLRAEASCPFSSCSSPTLLDAATAILESQTAGNSAINPISSFLPPPPLSIRHRLTTCMLLTVTATRRTAPLHWGTRIPLQRRRRRDHFHHRRRPQSHHPLSISRIHHRRVACTVLGVGHGRGDDTASSTPVPQRDAWQGRGGAGQKRVSMSRLHVANASAWSTSSRHERKRGVKKRNHELSIQKAGEG